jgi:acetyl-CoA carboxylase carboxyl transferase subunit alpha
MLQHSYFSVITPEGCAAILFRSSDKKEEAAAALHLTSKDMLALGVADDVVPEPDLAAHYQPLEAAKNLKAALCRHLDELAAVPLAQLLDARYAKYRKLGRVVGSLAAPGHTASGTGPLP